MTSLLFVHVAVAKLKCKFFPLLRLNDQVNKVDVQVDRDRIAECENNNILIARLEFVDFFLFG